MAHDARLLTDDQRRDWLRLMRSENVGPVTFRMLVNRFGGAAEALDALPDLSRRGGLKRAVRVPAETDIDSELDALARLGARLVATGEPGYPPRLAHIDQAPPLISIRGDGTIVERPAVAIVGARNASAGGRRFAREIATGLGAAGIVVVSGLARGVDGAAHEASVGTGTVAVLAGGLGRIYPEQHLELAESIGEEGLLVSEMPPNHGPRAKDFPRRNRIISGMSLGVVVVEAAARSGSLITARFALEQNREVFAVPGSPLDPRAEGTNRLIRQGAVLTTRIEDVLDVVAPMMEHPKSQDLGASEPVAPAFEDADEGLNERLYALLGPSPIDIDTLIRECSAPAPQINAALIELELAGRAHRHAGNRFSRAVG